MAVMKNGVGGGASDKEADQQRKEWGMWMAAGELGGLTGRSKEIGGGRMPADDGSWCEAMQRWWIVLMNENGGRLFGGEEATWWFKTRKWRMHWAAVMAMPASQDFDR